MSEVGSQGQSVEELDVDTSEGNIDSARPEANKQTRKEFIIKEVAVYLLQIYLFFWVAFLFSACLTNEEQLSEYLSVVITGECPEFCVTV